MTVYDCGHEAAKEEMMPAKPFSDEELKERHSKTQGLLNWDRMFDTIAADRHQIENLKLDLHIANRALEIDLTTVDLRKRIAELKKQAEIKDTLVRGVIVSAELHEQLEDVKAEHQRLRDGQQNILIEMQNVVNELDDCISESSPDLNYYRTVIKGAESYIEQIQQALRPQGEEPCEK